MTSQIGSTNFIVIPMCC